MASTDTSAVAPRPPAAVPVQTCRVCSARLDLWQVSRDGGREIRIYQCPNRHETWSYDVAAGEWTFRDAG